MSIALAFAVPRVTSVKWTPLVAVSLNARTMNTAMSARLTVAFGQKRSFLGGLHAVITPAAAMASIAGWNEEWSSSTNRPLLAATPAGAAIASSQAMTTRQAGTARRGRDMRRAASCTVRSPNLAAPGDRGTSAIGTGRG